MNFRYYFGVFVSLFLFPILLFDGKRIREKVPKLPEAKEPKGTVNNKHQKVIDILAIGESTIAGVGVDFHKNGFIGALANEIALKKNSSVHWKVYAKSGYTAKMIAEKMIPKIKCDRADFIVVGLGANDAFTLNSPKKWRFQINKLIDSLHQKFPNTPIYFTNMPPIKEFPAFTKTIKFVIGNLVEILGENLYSIVQNKANVYYNEQFITFDQWLKKHQLKDDINTFFSDGVHPSKITYELWGKEMAHFIINSKK